MTEQAFAHKGRELYAEAGGKLAKHSPGQKQAARQHTVEQDQQAKADTSAADAVWLHGTLKVHVRPSPSFCRSCKRRRAKFEEMLSSYKACWPPHWPPGSRKSLYYGVLSLAAVSSTLAMLDTDPLRAVVLAPGLHQREHM